MTTEQFEDLINDAGYETRPYSGRGMFGKECLSFTVDANKELEAVADIVAYAFEEKLEDDNPAEVVQAFSRASRDSMGRDDVIIYFPKFKYEGGTREGKR